MFASMGTMTKIYVSVSYDLRASTPCAYFLRDSSSARVFLHKRADVWCIAWGIGKCGEDYFPGCLVTFRGSGDADSSYGLTADEVSILKEELQKKVFSRKATR